MAVTKVTPAGLSLTQIGKNLVHNGSMAVAQKSSQTGLGAATAQTQVDRFKLISSTAGRVTANKAAAGGVTGHGSALKVDVTTVDSSIAAGDLMMIRHVIEAQNCQMLRWGDSTAQDVTLSFWMKSPKAGTHCVSLYQSDDGRGYIKEFTIASADTWEQFKITFPADTTGVIDNNTGAGLNINWPLVCGSTEQGAAGSWLSSGGMSATSNQQNLLDNTGNDVYLTGVQLEVGSIATDFAHEEYGTTLAKCQRYLHRIERLSSTNHLFSVGKMSTTTSVEFVVQHPVTMRASGTMSLSAVDDFYLRRLNTQTACTNLVTLVTGIDYVSLTATVSSGLTAGQVCILYLEADGDFIQWSAEL